MELLPENIRQATERYRAAAAQILTAFSRRASQRSGEAKATELNTSIEKFLALAANVDDRDVEAGEGEDVSELGEYGLTLLNDFAALSRQIELEEPAAEVEAVSVAVAEWIVRNRGEVRRLEPIVNALARAANRMHDSPALEALADLMTRVVRATAEPIKQDLEKMDPGRPWRVLNLNRGIVATRTHNIELMERIFDEFVTYLPEEAPAFFAEGMRQMEALDYPAHVRRVMRRYFDSWKRPTLH